MVYREFTKSTKMPKSFSLPTASWLNSFHIPHGLSYVGQGLIGKTNTSAFLEYIVFPVSLVWE